MSLHSLANHLQSAGRGEDKVLIHMTPREVSGLQSLAMAHGGSLTINPQTGLPEAGFLSRLLPTIIGAGLMLVPGMQPLGAAAITGAGFGIAKGSLKEGLMAGLGAYGGAGLASGLSAAGAAAPAANAVNATNAANAANVTNATNLAAVGPAPVIPNASGVFGGGASTVTGSGALGGAQTASLSQPITVSNLSSYTGGVPSTVHIPQATQVALSKPVAQSLLQGGSGLPTELAKNTVQQAATTAATNTAPVTFDNIKAGFGKATDSWEGLKGVWDKTPTGTGYGLLATGMGVMSDMQNKGTGAPAPSASYLRPYDYSIEQDPNAYTPSASTAERRYFV